MFTFTSMKSIFIFYHFPFADVFFLSFCLSFLLSFSLCHRSRIYSSYKSRLRPRQLLLQREYKSWSGAQTRFRLRDKQRGGRGQGTRIQCETLSCCGWSHSPVKEDGLDQRDHVSAGVVTGTNARYMDELRRQKTGRVSVYTFTLWVQTAFIRSSQRPSLCRSDSNMQPQLSV